MKSEWKISSMYLGGKKVYQVYRIKDTNAVDHSGNREYAGKWYKDKADAQAVVDEMNAKEGE